MSNRKRAAKKRVQKSSRLKDHKKTGKILRPPMRTVSNMNMVPWLRDTFPDMIWICALLKLYGDKAGIVLSARVLDRIDDVLCSSGGDVPDKSDRSILTGGLTAFEKIPDSKRAEVLAALQSDDLYERAFPWILVSGLQKYNGIPGSWLLQGWDGNERSVGSEESEAFLRALVSDARHGQSPIPTKAKAMYLRAWLKAGKISLPNSTEDDWLAILSRNPD